MIDLLICCELSQYDDFECLSKTPALIKDSQCIFLARVIDNHEIPENIIIGHDDGSEEYKFDPYGKEKYESMYSTEPFEVDGILVTPPIKIGVFA